MEPTQGPGLPVGEPVEGALASRPERRALAGRFVTLQPVDPKAHAEPLWRAAHDGSADADRVWTYMPYGPFSEPAEMQMWLEGLAWGRDPLFFTVIGEGDPIGMASYLNVETEMRRLELGHIWYAPAAQRTEANTEATYLLLGQAFGLGFRRVEWKCDALNLRSRTTALRMGFTFEGVFRQHMVVKGRNRDTAWYAMLDGEWPAARDAFERWLTTEPDRRPSLASLLP